MSKVQVIGTIAANPQAVWDVIGDFGAIAKWHPAIADSRAEGSRPGALRRLTLKNGDRLVERLEEFNDGERYYSYSLVEGPLPVAEYYSTLHVRAAYDAPSATVEWTGAFTAKDAPESDVEHLIQSIYQAGIDALRQQLTANPRS
ncbi:MAG TPA: SRPBCC family protein [Stellaceae bacterium]|nr:SRPBCC family protein [Stellaceae bacterium]